MAAVLAGLQGRFILSLNDVPGVRETFGSFRMHPVRTTYTIRKGPGQSDRAELLIANFDLGILASGRTVNRAFRTGFNARLKAPETTLRERI